MRVLVVGGSGYVGTHAIRELADAGHEVIVYDNLSTGHAALCNGFDLIQGDMNDHTRLVPLINRVEAVMHFAAAAYVAESVTNPRKYFSNNVESALALLDAVLASKVKTFIFSSSCAVYGTPDSLPITENFHKEPLSPYGASKLFLEHALSAYRAAHGLNYVALRYFNAAGAHANGLIGEVHHPETHLIPLAIRAALGNAPPLKIFGRDHGTPDGTCIRDYIHVSDLGAAHVAALEYLRGGGESICLNLGTGRGTSIQQLLRRFQALTGMEIPHEFAPRRAGDPPSLYADANKANELLGWSAKRDLDEILTSALRWEKKLLAGRASRGPQRAT